MRRETEESCLRYCVTSIKLLALLVQKYKSGGGEDGGELPLGGEFTGRYSSLLPPYFTATLFPGFPSTKVQILSSCWGGRQRVFLATTTQFPCFPGTKVQILTQLGGGFPAGIPRYYHPVVHVNAAAHEYPPPDLALELQDDLQCNIIVLQLLALGMPLRADVTEVYFRINFYDFDECRSGVLAGYCSVYLLY